jgi:asparagine synthase (glutamine-hydrolysing)
MSGIAGIVRFDGAPVEPGSIERMTAAMAHRGPDGIRHWSSGSVALGQCMLCTTPESLDERGPLANEDASLVLVMDGRVDNPGELRRELLGRGAVLRDRTDAELVLRAYEAWGEDCLARIDGDCVFVVWDARRREAFCARDRFGQKPFHYHWDGRTLAFASDVHAVLALPWVPQVLNEGMVAEFLANEWLSLDETFWQGVLRLPQAHRMTVDARGPRLDRYWAPDLHATLRYRTDDEYAEHYLALLTEAVRRMSRTIGPLACEVSGGLDSSALLAVAERLRREGKLLAPSLDAYTLEFNDDSDANEMDFARAMGAHLGIPVREVAPTHEPLDWYRERAQRLRTFPSYPNGTMGVGLREIAASRGSRAILCGVGGDEWLCGTRGYYADELAARDWRSLAASFAADRRDYGTLRSVRWLLRQGCLPLLPDAVKRPIRRVRAALRDRRNDDRSWLAPPMQRLLDERRAHLRPPDAGGKATASHRRSLNTLSSPFLAQARALEEGLAAGCGIEVRRPLFAKDLVEFAFATPDDLKLRGNTDKYLHRLAMRGYLPEAVRTRRTKADFVIVFLRHVPAIEAALRGGLAQARAEWVLQERAAELLAHVGDPNLDDAPEWKLWSLIGCDALAARG